MVRRKKAIKELSPEERLKQALVPVEEQPYLIPENWCWTRLGNITEVVGGGTPSSKVEEYYKNGNIPWISPIDLSGYNEIYISRGAKNITKLGLEKSSAQLMPSGTVCLSSRAPIGYVVIAKNELCTNQGFKSFLPAPCYIPEYLYWYLKGNKELLESYASGTTFLELSGSKASLVEFPLAPLPEQHRIVDRIESLFAELDEAKEKAQAVVDGFELRKSAILHKAFTGELTKQWRKEHSVSPNTLLVDIEKFSRNWQKKDQQFLKDAQSTSQVVTLDNGHTWIRCTIGAISRVTNGSTPSRKFPQYWDGTIPWVSSGEVRNNIIENTNECITQEGYDSSSVKLLPVGTVLIAMIGEGKTRGQSAILAINAAINQNIAAVVVDHGLVSSRYIWYWFQMNYARNREKGSGTGPQALNCQRVRELDFFAPSLPEQKEIVCILDKLLIRELQAREAAEAVLAQIDTMKKAILARAFRGELGTNDPAEEWAGKLVQTVP